MQKRTRLSSKQKKTRVLEFLAKKELPDVGAILTREHLAKETALSNWNLRMALAELKKEELIVVIANLPSGGGQSANTYKITSAGRAYLEGGE